MDKRSEPRMDRDVGIFVHVHTCDEHPELIGKSIPCDAMDFSSHGIRFKSNLLLPPGSLINVTLGVGKPLSVFLLLGEVRWEFEKDGQLMMGVNLFDGEQGDLERWADTFDFSPAEDMGLE